VHQNQKGSFSSTSFKIHRWLWNRAEEKNNNLMVKLKAVIVLGDVADLRPVPDVIKLFGK